MATDCTADFVVEDNSASADIRINSSGAKSRPNAWSVPLVPARRFQPAPIDEGEKPDAHKMSQRQKMIDKGKNTLGYQRYLKQVPKMQREGKDPVTPDIRMVGSKRKFDGLVRAWRKQLHAYDLPEDKAEEIDEPEETVKADGTGWAVQAVQAAAQKRAFRNGPETAEGDKEENEDGYVVVERQSAKRQGGTPGGEVQSMSEESQEGSMDGYVAPSNNKKSGQKRTLKRSFDTAGATSGAVAAAAVAGVPAPAPPRLGLRPQASAWFPRGATNAITQEPQPKRSATSRSMDTSNPALASTCSKPGVPAAAVPTAPTSFAGLGLASRIGSSGAEGSNGSAAASVAVAPRAERRKLDREDNVVALILGPEAGSCMSWASDQ